MCLYCDTQLQLFSQFPYIWLHNYFLSMDSNTHSCILSVPRIVWLSLIIAFSSTAMVITETF